MRARSSPSQRFGNKLWNIARYIEGVLGDNPNREAPVPVSAADHWILSKLHHSAELINGHLDNYRFSEAYAELYHFIWDDLADWYIEASKALLEPTAAGLFARSRLDAGPSFCAVCHRDGLANLAVGRGFAARY